MLSYTTFCAAAKMTITAAKAGPPPDVRAMAPNISDDTIEGMTTGAISTVHLFCGIMAQETGISREKVYKDCGLPLSYADPDQERRLDEMLSSFNLLRTMQDALAGRTPRD